MKKVKKIKREKGITLIALVITIIVLLILASISIATLTGENGILVRAQNAKEQTQRTEVIEKAKNDILAKQAKNNNGDISKDELVEILEKYFDIPDSLSDEDILNTTLTTKSEYGNYDINVYEICEGSVSNVDIADSNIQDMLKIDPNANSSEEKSPYVKYNERLCRVLYNDNKHGLQIITEESVEDVTLGKYDDKVTADEFTYDGTAIVDNNFKKAAASYNKAVDTLNAKAKEYKDNDGIATDARCLGSSPYFEKDTEEMYNDNTNGYMKTYGWNYKFKVGDEDYEEDVKQLNALRLFNSSKYIWLASRRVAEAYSLNTYFYIRYVNNNGKVQDSVLCYVNNSRNASSYSQSNGFRPIFRLLSDVKIDGGQGTKEDPYTLLK